MNSFSESQRFKQWWIWVLFIGLLLLNSLNFLYNPLGKDLDKLAGYPQIYDIFSKTNEALFYIKVASVVVVGGYLLLFSLFRLRVTIDETGISYQFFPIHTAPVKKEWQEIERAYVRQFRPSKGSKQKYYVNEGRTYSVKGPMGLQLILKNGERVLLGTQQADTLSATLQSLAGHGKINPGVVDTAGIPV